MTLMKSISGIRGTIGGKESDALTPLDIVRFTSSYAALIQKHMKQKLNTFSRDRGVKQAGFHVLVGASMPNVLIELGFITNRNDYKLLNKSKYRTKMAQSIFNAIITYKNTYEENL